MGYQVRDLLAGGHIGYAEAPGAHLERVLPYAISHGMRVSPLSCSVEENLSALGSVRNDEALGVYVVRLLPTQLPIVREAPHPSVPVGVQETVAFQ